MTDERVEELRQWALSEMAWQRAQAEATGTKVKPIKGVRKMNIALKQALTADSTFKVRGRAIVLILHDFVLPTYGIPADAV